MATDIRFAFSFEAIDIAPILAHWATLEWMRDELEHISFPTRIASYAARTNSSSMPITLVAFDHDLPIGMVSLKKDDLPSRPDLSPWFSGFYVIREYRRQHIGTALHDRIMAHAAYLGLNNLFVHTHQAAWFYANRGWTELGTEAGPHGQQVQLFHRSTLHVLDLPAK